MTKSLLRRPNSQSLLTKLISHPQLISEVQKLDASVVKKIIYHIGLEDSGELLMLITSEQLQEVMDEDVWMSERPGKDESLNAKRFCTWIEVLLEVGADFAARKISEMDEDLLASVLSQLIWVMDSDQLALLTRSAEDDEYSESKYLDKALESTFSLEVDGYLVMSKETFQWDAVSDLLLALQKDHRDLASRILARIEKVTLDQVEEFDGLYNLLKEGESLFEDVSSDREARREKEGFVGPSSAAAFLKLVEQTTIEALIAETEMDHISKMYFRSFKPSKVRVSEALSSEFLNILSTHGVSAGMSVKQLSSVSKPSKLHSYLADLARTDETLWKQKISELNFVANVLLSGYAHKKGIRLRPVEAMDLAISVYDQGLLYIDRNNLEVDPEEIIKIFKIGWKERGGPR